MNKNSIQNLILIFFLLLVSLLTAYLIYNSYSNDNKNSIIQQKIKQLQETQKRIEQINQEIEKLKKFDEKEFAEKVSNILNFENYLSTSTDIQLDGVEIIYNYTTSTKLVINHKEGYQIEIPNDLILNRSWSTSNLNFDSLEAIEAEVPVRYWSMMYILVYDKSKDADFFEDAKKDYLSEIKGLPQEGGIAQENRYFIITPKSEEIEINGEKFYKITYIYKEIYKEPQDFDKLDEDIKKYLLERKKEIENSEPFEWNYGYILFKEDKIYYISIFSKDLESFVKTFKFISN